MAERNLQGHFCTPAHIYLLLLFIEGSNKEETYLIERLFSSSLVAIVTQSQKRKLKLCHFKVCMLYAYPVMYNCLELVSFLHLESNRNM